MYFVRATLHHQFSVIDDGVRYITADTLVIDFAHYKSLLLTLAIFCIFTTFRLHPTMNIYAGQFET
jgi:hypothetical protein